MVTKMLQGTWTILKNDLRVWVHQPINIVVTFLPPVAFLLIQALAAEAVGRSPVALVTLDQDASGQQMRQILHDADVFRITDASPEQAQRLFNNVQVAAIITIPANFTQRVGAHDQAPIDVKVNNLNLDFTNDIRRSVPDAITQFYQAQGSVSPIKVTTRERDLRSRDVEFFQYAVIPSIILVLIISGLVNGGLATAREWESRTVKELLLAPVPRGAIIAGKVFASSILAFAYGILLLLLGYVFGWTQPEGIYWLNALAAMAMVSLFGSGLGIAIGAALQRIQAVSDITIMFALYMFFLAGGTGVLAFQPEWLQNIAVFIPLTYGRHTLEMAVFYSSPDLFGRDVAILAVSALATVAVGILSLRRGIAQ